jgi:GNAT superfamily N-acetyltransferase
MRASELGVHVVRLLEAEARFWGSAAPASKIVELPGVLASVVNATPDRSMFNWVICNDNQALKQNYDELARIYDAAGVRAWTVWLEPNNHELPAFLAERGHKLDASPVSMAAELSKLSLSDASDLDWEETKDLPLLADLNDQAYGFPPPAFTAALLNWGIDPAWRGYVARKRGRVQAGLLCWDSPAGDCGISGVATLPEARGAGLATRLLSQVLREAQQRGRTTTSLQASSKGRSVYARLGYQELGTMSMWEHRVPNPAA